MIIEFERALFVMRLLSIYCTFRAESSPKNTMLWLVSSSTTVCLHSASGTVLWPILSNTGSAHSDDDNRVLVAMMMPLPQYHHIFSWAASNYALRGPARSCDPATNERGWPSAFLQVQRSATLRRVDDVAAITAVSWKPNVQLSFSVAGSCSSVIKVSFFVFFCLVYYQVLFNPVVCVHFRAIIRAVIRAMLR